MNNFSEADYQKRVSELKERFTQFQVDWNYEHNVSICERSKTVIEPLISDEFFLSYHKEFDHSSCAETKYLIFDYDGVLADSDEANLACWAELRAGGDYKKAKEMRDEYFDKPRHHKNHGLSQEEFEQQAVASWNFIRYMANKEFCLFEGFVNEIAKISNTRLAIVSSSSKELLILPKIRNCKLNFTHILGREDNHSKEEKITQVCKDWGISPTQVYYFTDTKDDVIELQNFMDKTKIIGCSWGWAGKDKLLEILPESQILDKFEDIHKLFSKKTNLQKLTLKGLDEVNFYPSEFRQRGQNFIQNVLDWCISRDLTWGHKIPVWYNLDTNPEKKFFSYQEWLKNPEIRHKFQVSPNKPDLPGNWVQESKILDTWFSSSLWPLSTLDFVETVKPQKTVVIVGGGDAFKTDQEMLEELKQREIDIRQQKIDWKINLFTKLSSAGIEVFYPQMPNKQNANYEAWKIWFEKYIAQIDPENELFLVGHSLGGNFLLKYLSENSLKVKQLHLVAACTDAYTFEIQTELDLIKENCEQIFVYHSTDDQIVPFEQFNQIISRLPTSKRFIFDNRAHFNIPHFPEIEDYILYSNYFYTFSKYISLDQHFQNRFGAHAIIYNPKTKKLLFPKINWDILRNVSEEKAEYHLVGGKLELGETAQKTLLREFEEETGISRNEITKLDFVGKIFLGFNFYKNNELQNIRLESNLFYVETESEKEGVCADYQTTKWVDLKDVKGKIINGFEESIEFVLNKFSTNFRTEFNNQLMEQNLAKKVDFEEFYPTQTMVTAKEIFYLWIVRMITLGKYFTNRVPFENLVITPTILDEKGRKMSKSLKNGLEPGEAIAKFSSDSLRLSMLSGMIPGRNMRFGGNLADRLMEKYRNFGNKIWNVARFLEFKSGNWQEKVTTALEKPKSTFLKTNPVSNEIFLSPESLASASWWILQKYLDLQDNLEHNLQNYELAHSVDVLYGFLWDNFADWYIEYLKTDETQVAFAKSLFQQFIITVSPFIPFETEVLWSEFFGQTSLLAFALERNEQYRQLWSKNPNSQVQAEEFAAIIRFIQDLRSTRGLFAIDPAKSIQVYSQSVLLNKYSKFIQITTRSEIVPEQKQGLYSVQKEGYEYSLDILAYIPNKQTEVNRTNKIIKDLETQIEFLQNQLQNPNFVQNADPEVVTEKRQQLLQRKQELDQQQSKINFLNN